MLLLMCREGHCRSRFGWVRPGWCGDSAAFGGTRRGTL